MTTSKIDADERIIQLFRSGQDQDREKAFQLLYQPLYRKAVGYLINQGASEMQAKTAYHIALMRLEQKVIEPGFVLNSSLSSFLMGILRLVWLEERRKVFQYNDVEDTPKEKLATEEQPMEESEAERLHRLLQQCLQQMGQECKRILFYKYWLNLNMKEIAERMGFSGENAHYSAANKKNRCMKRLVVECTES
jgi:RNA polymerase sigma factor (sigma-70 family)